MQSAEDWSAKNTPALFAVRDPPAPNDRRMLHFSVDVLAPRSRQLAPDSGRHGSN